MSSCFPPMSIWLVPEKDWNMIIDGLSLGICFREIDGCFRRFLKGTSRYQEREGMIWWFDQVMTLITQLPSRNGIGSLILPPDKSPAWLALLGDLAQFMAKAAGSDKLDHLLPFLPCMWRLDGVNDGKTAFGSLTVGGHLNLMNRMEGFSGDKAALLSFRIKVFTKALKESCGIVEGVGDLFTRIANESTH